MQNSFVQNSNLNQDNSETAYGKNNYLSRKGAAKYLAVSLTTIDNYVKLGLLTKYKLVGSTRFKTVDLDNLYQEIE